MTNLQLPPEEMRKKAIEHQVKTQVYSHAATIYTHMVVSPIWQEQTPEQLALNAIALAKHFQSAMYKDTKHAPDTNSIASS